MPTPHYKRVLAFMRRAGQEAPLSPVIPDAGTRVLRAKLMLEEALETVRALGVSVCMRGAEVSMDGLVFEDTGDPSIEEVVDGCADISVVTVGTLIAFGVDDEPVLEEVDGANLRKFGPGARVRQDGKWIKPPDWVPPDIKGVLVRQSQRTCNG